MNKPKVIVYPKFPLKLEHSEEYSNCILQLMDTILVEFICDIDFKKNETSNTVRENEAINEISYVFKTLKSAESFYSGLDVIMKQNENPFMSTIKSAKLDRIIKSVDEDKYSESIVVIDQNSFICNEGGSSYASGDFVITDNLNTIGEEYHHFFVVIDKPATVLTIDKRNEESDTVIKTESVVANTVIYDDTDSDDELIVTSKEEKLLLVLLRSNEICRLFQERLREAFEVTKTRVSVEIDEDVSEVVLELYIRYRRANEIEIRAFIGTFMGSLSNVDNSVEVEFNTNVTDLDWLLVYLESSKRNGGDIVLNSEKVLNERYLNITFESTATKVKFLAQDLATIRSYRIYNYQMLNVNEPFVDKSFEVDSRMIVLRNLANKDNLFLVLLAENLQTTNSVARDIVKSSVFTATHYVEYKNEIDFVTLYDRLQRRNEKGRLAANVLKCYKTRTLIIYICDRLADVENIENELKTHFCDKYEQFLQIRKFNKNFYLITFPTSSLLNECLQQDKSVFKYERIIYEKLFNFEMLTELRAATVTLIDSNNNERDLKVNDSKAVAVETTKSEFTMDDTFDAAIRVFFLLDRERHLSAFQKKLEPLSATVITEKPYGLRISYYVSKSNENKLKNMISTYLELNFKVEKVKLVTADEIRKNIRFDGANVHLTQLDGQEIEVIGVADDVEKLVADVDDYVKSKATNKKELIMDEQFDPLVKALFICNQVHFREFSQKFEAYGLEACVEDNRMIRIVYDATKTNEKKITDMVLTYLELVFKIERIQGMSRDEVMRYNRANVAVIAIGQNEVELVGEADDVEKLVHDITHPALQKPLETRKEIVIDETFDPLLKALFALHGVQMRLFQQKMGASSINVTIPKEGRRLILSYDGEKFNEAKIKNLVMTYLELEFKIEKVEKTSVQEIENTFKFDARKVYLTQSDQDTVEIIGVADDVEQLAADFASLPQQQQQNFDNLKQITFDVNFHPFVKTLFLLNSKHLDQFKQKFEEQLSYRVTRDAQAKKITISYDDSKANEKKIKNLVTTYLELEFKSERFHGISADEIRKNFEYDTDNVAILENGGEIEVTGIANDVELLEQMIERYQANRRGGGESVVLEFDLNQKPVYKLLQRGEHAERFLCNDASFEFITANRVRITHDDESRLKELLHDFENSYKSVEQGVPYSTELDFSNNEAILVERVDNHLIRLIGSNNEVDHMLSEIDRYFDGDLVSDSSFSITIAQSRLLVLAKYKHEIEQRYPGLQFKFKQTDTNESSYSASFENATRSVIYYAKQQMEHFFSSLDVYVFSGYEKQVAKALKERDNDLNLFKKLQTSSLVCAFEFNDIVGDITAYAAKEVSYDQIKRLLDEFIKENLPNVAEASIGGGVITKMVKVNLYEYRVLFINRLDKLVLKRWPMLKFNFVRKGEKIELICEQEEAIADAEKMIKNMIDKILCECVTYEEGTVRLLHEKERDIVKSLYEMKVSCFVDYKFNVTENNGNVLIYSTSQEAINKCKNYLQDFLSKH